MPGKLDRTAQHDTSTASGPVPFVYRVVIEPDDDRFYATIPRLPGCYSWGHTFEEALSNVKEALELWIETKRELDEPIEIDDPDTIRNATFTIGVLI